MLNGTLEEALDPDEEYPGGLPGGSDFWKPNPVWLSTESVAQVLGLVQEFRDRVCVRVWWRGRCQRFRDRPKAYRFELGH